MERSVIEPVDVHAVTGVLSTTSYELVPQPFMGIVIGERRRGVP
jgi:hypothetical protein